MNGSAILIDTNAYSLLMKGDERVIRLLSGIELVYLGEN